MKEALFLALASALFVFTGSMALLRLWWELAIVGALSPARFFCGFMEWHGRLEFSWPEGGPVRARCPWCGAVGKFERGGEFIADPREPKKGGGE